MPILRLYGLVVLNRCWGLGFWRQRRPKQHSATQSRWVKCWEPRGVGNGWVNGFSGLWQFGLELHGLSVSWRISTPSHTGILNSQMGTCAGECNWKSTRFKSGTIHQDLFHFMHSGQYLPFDQIHATTTSWISVAMRIISSRKRSLREYSGQANNIRQSWISSNMRILILSETAEATVPPTVRVNLWRCPICCGNDHWRKIHSVLSKPKQQNDSRLSRYRKCTGSKNFCTIPGRLMTRPRLRIYNGKFHRKRRRFRYLFGLFPVTFPAVVQSDIHLIYLNRYRSRFLLLPSACKSSAGNWIDCPTR